MSQAGTEDSNDALPAGETSLAHYLDALAADASIPGGGGAAAVAGALAAALLSMVSRFTLGRTRYRESWPHIEPLLAESEGLRRTLLEAADDDARAYGAVAAAMRLPRATGSQRRERRVVLQAALRGAAAVPLETAQAARRTLDLAATAAEYGNPNLVSDAGVAAALAEAALQRRRAQRADQSGVHARPRLCGYHDAALAELLSGAGAARDAVLTQVQGGNRRVLKAHSSTLTRGRELAVPPLCGGGTG